MQSIKTKISIILLIIISPVYALQEEHKGHIGANGLYKVSAPISWSAVDVQQYPGMDLVLEKNKSMISVRFVDRVDLEGVNLNSYAKGVLTSKEFRVEKFKIVKNLSELNIDKNKALKCVFTAKTGDSYLFSSMYFIETEDYFITIHGLSINYDLHDPIPPFEEIATSFKLISSKKMNSKPPNSTLKNKIHAFDDTFSILVPNDWVKLENRATSKKPVEIFYDAGTVMVGRYTSKKKPFKQETIDKMSFFTKDIENIQTVEEPREKIINGREAIVYKILGDLDPKKEQKASHYVVLAFIKSDKHVFFVMFFNHLSKKKLYEEIIDSVINSISV